MAKEKFYLLKSFGEDFVENEFEAGIYSVFLIIFVI